jgi:hypothetical protein
LAKEHQQKKVTSELISQRALKMAAGYQTVDKLIDQVEQGMPEPRTLSVT